MNPMHAARSALLATSLLLAALAAPGALAQPADTSFSFQGRLYDAGIAFDGPVTLRITPWDSETGGVALSAPVETLPLELSEGVFTTELDFGPTVFLGNPVWLAIEVDANGGGFVPMTPRQRVAPTPYAVHAQSVAVDAVDQFALQDGSVTATKIGPGAVGATQVDPSEVQRRVGPDCAAGDALAGIGEDGSTTCVAMPGSGWSSGSTAITTTRKVSVGSNGYTGAQLWVVGNSGISTPQLDLREVQHDFSRLTLSTFVPATDTSDSHFGFWTIAARTSHTDLDGPDTDRINFFNSRSGDMLSLLGNGYLGIGPGASDPDAPMMLVSRGQFAPGVGNGRGDFHIGNSALGLSFGVATGGGGAGAARMWTKGGLVNQIFLGSDTHGDVLAVKEDLVGIGTTAPTAELDVDGAVRVRGLADATSTGFRSVYVGPDGTLANGTGASWHAISSAAFQVDNSSIGHSRNYGGLSVQTTTTGLIWAPLNLPHATRVIAMRVTMVDNTSSDFDALITNMRQDAIGYSGHLILQTAGIGPDMRVFESDPSEAALVIDNETRVYSIVIKPVSGTSWQGSASMVRSVRLLIE